ncbi:hypothetical protein PSYMO_30558 [Pseudomonas amygdali pv. mori str. 301020]|uniref:Gamma-glutamylcyclotransferase AIG2-like domain-containing protein n=1 Tax=Pseudomonas amygdali pv. mori str. 301020 TaxID=629261 RepID=A0A656GGU8_PSEA0|nr:hypothetical protein PSYMO_27549 [Pseudomonas amygdali pv. mori str. 301020]EGH25526.1 hypothetical protein PSYMO_30558 [Pseudomonas amygdali pv. mori str. 301020]MBN4178106.1 hypothetical protein [Pseudomonas savastanoi pv. phaseolicola]
MIEHVFVYGALGPSRPTEHVFKRIDGSWVEARSSGESVKDG